MNIGNVLTLKEGYHVRGIKKVEVVGFKEGWKNPIVVKRVSTYTDEGTFEINESMIEK